MGFVNFKVGLEIQKWVWKFKSGFGNSKVGFRNSKVGFRNSKVGLGNSKVGFGNSKMFVEPTNFDPHESGICSVFKFHPRLFNSSDTA